MKKTYFTPEVNMVGIFCEDMIRTSRFNGVLEEYGDGDSVSVNELLGITQQ